LPGAIITPEKEMSFQLIAVDGFVQYTLNGNVMYEYDYGDEIQTTADNGKTVETTIYTRKKYPAYDKGHFGLRMVRSAHIYTDVEVWKLVKK
jgi:hypothetical protein